MNDIYYEVHDSLTDAPDELIDAEADKVFQTKYGYTFEEAIQRIRDKHANSSPFALQASTATAVQEG